MIKIKNTVNMWLALDSNQKFITIENADISKDYFCPSCGSIVRARAKNSDIVTPHFYHLNKGLCNCEAEIHKYWKENYINIGDKITLPKIGLVECIDKRIELKLKTDEKIYQPDLIIKTKHDKYKYIIFEIFNTNKKSIKKYKPIWQNIGSLVYEVDVAKIDRKQIDYMKCDLVFDIKKSKHIKEIQQNLFSLRKRNIYDYDLILLINRILSFSYKLLDDRTVRKATFENIIIKNSNKWWDRDYATVCDLNKEINNLKIYGR